MLAGVDETLYKATLLCHGSNNRGYFHEIWPGSNNMYNTLQSPTSSAIQLRQAPLWTRGRIPVLSATRARRKLPPPQSAAPLRRSAIHWTQVSLACRAKTASTMTVMARRLANHRSFYRPRVKRRPGDECALLKRGSWRSAWHETSSAPSTRSFNRRVRPFWSCADRGFLRYSSDRAASVRGERL